MVSGDEDLYVTVEGPDGVLGAAYQVDAGGTVRAYDVIAGHFTVHHGLTELQEHQIRDAARLGKRIVKMG